MARSSSLARTLDQKGGRIAAGLIGPLLTRHRRLPEKAERIAIIQPTAIGDTVISSGAIAAIHARYPDAALTIFHGPTNAAAVKMLPTPHAAVRTSFNNPLKALSAVRAAKPDLAVDLTPWPYTTALVARLAAPIAIGFAPEGSARGRLFDITVAHRADRHETANLAAMAAVFDDAPHAMQLAGAPHALTDQPIERLVLAHIRAGGSRAEDKHWPPANWVALTHALNAAGYRVGFTGTPADAPAIDAILAAIGPAADAISLAGRLSLAQMADLIARAPLLVTIDTGILHIAAATGARSLGLHGPTRAWRWGSQAAHARSIESPHPAAGYMLYGFELPLEGVETMPAITPDMAIEQALAMLAEDRGARMSPLPPSGGE